MITRILHLAALCLRDKRWLWIVIAISKRTEAYSAEIIRQTDKSMRRSVTERKGGKTSQNHNNQCWQPIDGSMIYDTQLQPESLAELPMYTYFTILQTTYTYNFVWSDKWLISISTDALYSSLAIVCIVLYGTLLSLSLSLLFLPIQLGRHVQQQHSMTAAKKHSYYAQLIWLNFNGIVTCFNPLWII